jgi:hypothetical protein
LPTACRTVGTKALQGHPKNFDAAKLRIQTLVELEELTQMESAAIELNTKTLIFAGH